MERCDTCKWWSQNITQPLEWGKCQLTENNYEYDRNKHTWSSDHPNSRAVAVDAESYYAVLETHNNFGCIQHEPIPLDPATDQPAEPPAPAETR